MIIAIKVINFHDMNHLLKLHRMLLVARNNGLWYMQCTITCFDLFQVLRMHYEKKFRP